MLHDHELVWLRRCGCCLVCANKRGVDEEGKAARALAHAREQEAELDELAAARLQGYGAGLEDLRAPRWVAVGGGAGRRGGAFSAL